MELWLGRVWARWIVGGLVGLGAAACSSGGGRGGAPTPGGGPGAIDEDLVAGVVFAATTYSPELGATVRAGEGAGLLAGASLDLDAGVHGDPRTLGVGLPAVAPSASPLGMDPLSAALFSPDGLVLDAGATPGRLSLPLSAGLNAEEAYAARWDDDLGRWEPVGAGPARLGRTLELEVDRLGWYGVFRAGRSLVRMRNDAPSSVAPSGLVVNHLAGPVAPAGSVATMVFRAEPPAAGFDRALLPGEALDLHLLPGVHAFHVTFLDAGVTADLAFEVPTLANGADDEAVDQTLSLGTAGAISDDPTTDASISFLALLQPADRAPVVTLDALAPAGATLTDAETGLAPTADTRVLHIGPIASDQLDSPTDLILRATATDAEDTGTLDLVWTWSNGTDPVEQTPQNGATVGRSFLPPQLPAAAGLYTVHAAAYDSGGRVGVGTFLVDVVVDPPERLEVVADRQRLDFGRLDAKRDQGATPLAGPLTNLCEWVDTDADGSLDAPFFTTLGTGPDPANPDQDPGSLACVVALVTPSVGASGEPLVGGFESLGTDGARGTYYSAFDVPAAALQPGSRIANDAVLALYNEHVLALAASGALTADTAVWPGRPPGTQAVPILFEAPDDPDAAATTNDCGEFGGCAESTPGATTVRFRLGGDPTPLVREGARLAWPDEGAAPCALELVPTPVDPGPAEAVLLEARTFPVASQATLRFQVTGSDGFADDVQVTTDGFGRATYLLPPAAPGVTHEVTLTCGTTELATTFGR